MPFMAKLAVDTADSKLAPTGSITTGPEVLMLLVGVTNDKASA